MGLVSWIDESDIRTPESFTLPLSFFPGARFSETVPSAEAPSPAGGSGMAHLLSCAAARALRDSRRKEIARRASPPAAREKAKERPAARRCRKYAGARSFGAVEESTSPRAAPDVRSFPVTCIVSGRLRVGL